MAKFTGGCASTLAFTFHLHRWTQEGLRGSPQEWFRSTVSPCFPSVRASHLRLPSPAFLGCTQPTTLLFSPLAFFLTQSLLPCFSSHVSFPFGASLMTLAQRTWLCTRMVLSLLTAWHQSKLFGKVCILKHILPFLCLRILSTFLQQTKDYSHRWPMIFGFRFHSW